MSEPHAPRGAHAATAAVCDLVRAMVELGGGTTATLAQVADLHRDTARRVLAELEAQGWAVQVELRNSRAAGAVPETHWQLAPGLVELAMSWLDLQQERIDAIASQVQRATAGRRWRVVDGQRLWLPETDEGGRA
jgi:DNA-binding IclR family transcriptional regulator